MSQPIILSFDVEEHWRIEAAAGIPCPSPLREGYGRRMADCTFWLLDQLEHFGIRATFYVVGQSASEHPEMVRAMHRAGHEVASHSWDHRRVHHFNPETFRADLRKSKDALEQITGQAVVGFRAPTFSVVRSTGWAIDVLAEEGFLYDSSVYPVRHDRYGVPEAPRGPFRIRGRGHTLLEIPPATWRWACWNLPVGGGGYFRLLPLFVLDRAIDQTRRACNPPVTMLYFHPWEFDPRQTRLPLKPLNAFRTYVGVWRARPRLVQLLGKYHYSRAVDVAADLIKHRNDLPEFEMIER